MSEPIYDVDTMLSEAKKKLKGNLCVFKGAGSGGGFVSCSKGRGEVASAKKAIRSANKAIDKIAKRGGTRDAAKPHFDTVDANYPKLAGKTQGRIDRKRGQAANLRITQALKKDLPKEFSLGRAERRETNNSKEQTIIRTLGIKKSDGTRAVVTSYHDAYNGRMTLSVTSATGKRDRMKAKDIDTIAKIALSGFKKVVKDGKVRMVYAESTEASLVPRLRENLRDKLLT